MFYVFFIVSRSLSMLSSLVLPRSNNTSSRNSPIDLDYYSYQNYNDQSIVNDYYNSHSGVHSRASTPMSDISWLSPNTNDDPSFCLSNNDGKFFFLFLCCFKS